MIHQLRLFLIALQFLTRVPVPRSVGYEAAWLNQSARHFPAVGLLVGLVGAGVLWGALQWWPLPVAVGLSMATTLWLTGAFHEDGLADTLDGLGGAADRERALQIMKDSRIGAYGAIGLIVVLGLKAVTLASMAPWLAMPALLLMHAASRGCATLVMKALRYAGDAAHAKAKPLVQQVSNATAVIATGWVVLIAVALGVLGWLPARSIIAALVAAAITTVAMAAWLQRRLGGYTGDGLGATQQFAELAGLLGASAAYGLLPS